MIKPPPDMPTPEMIAEEKAKKNAEKAAADAECNARTREGKRLWRLWFNGVKAKKEPRSGLVPRTPQTATGLGVPADAPPLPRPPVVRPPSVYDASAGSVAASSRKSQRGLCTDDQPVHDQTQE